MPFRRLTARTICSLTSISSRMLNLEPIILYSARTESRHSSIRMRLQPANQALPRERATLLRIWYISLCLTALRMEILLGTILTIRQRRRIVRPFSAVTEEISRVSLTISIISRISVRLRSGARRFWKTMSRTAHIMAMPALITITLTRVSVPMNCIVSLCPSLMRKA